MIECPRCTTPLSVRTASPGPEAAPVSADVCDACGGIWLDGAELAQVSPSLGGLPFRAAEIAEIAIGSDLACPRCSAGMRSFDLLDVPIDACRECQGVWLDGGEYEAMKRAETGEATGAAPAPAPAALRCSSCGAEIARDKSYFSDQGLVCAGCHLATTPEQMRERAVRSGAAATWDRAVEAHAALQAERRADQDLRSELRALRSEVRRLQWRS